MVRTSLYPRQQALGATFGDFQGWELPFRYTSFDGEYRAATGGVALRDASAGGRLRLEGKDALDLLHRLSTNDLLALKPGQASNTVLTSNKGRVLDHLRVHCMEDHLLVYTSPQSLQRVVEWIDLYTFLEEITVTDITGETEVLQLVGPQAPAFLEGLTQGRVSLEDSGVARESIAGIPVTIVRDDSLKVPAYDLLVTGEEAASLWQLLLEEGKAWELSPLGEEAFEVLRIEAGLPIYGRELSEQVNPLEGGLRPSISFTKGCYIGQEVVLRLDTYRKVQRHLVRLELSGEGVPLVGEKLLVDSKAVGTLTSVGRIPREDRVVALGLLRAAYDKPGQVVEIASQGHRWEGKVISLEQYAQEGSGT